MIGGLVIGLAGRLLGGQFDAGLVQVLLFGLIEGLIFGLAAGLFFGLYGLTIDGGSEIDLVERLTWSWKRATFRLVVGLLLGLLIRGPSAGWPLGVICGLGAGIFGLDYKEVNLENVSLSPNEGIWQSGKTGLVVGLVGGLVIGAVVGLLLGLIGELLWLPFLLVGGLVIGGSFLGLIGGLRAFVMHFILRFFFSLKGNFPWDLISFLDHAAERLLLRKVGGSYIFVHRQLLDYFASRDEPRSRRVK